MQLTDAASPVAAFVRDECVLETEASVEKAVLYRAWCTSCERNGGWPGPNNSFGRQLMAATGGAVRASKRRSGGSRAAIYTGIRLAKMQPVQPEEELPF